VNLYSFEADYQELSDNIETYVDVVFSFLSSDFFIMPKGNGFIEYPAFEEGYEALKEMTKGFAFLEPLRIYRKTIECPMIFIVLRTMLGFTPPEWAYIASNRCNIPIT
jgi:RNA recognition motif-containing protein